MSREQLRSRSIEAVKSILAESLFALHAVIVLFFFIPFFIPTSAWPGRIDVHFAYLSGLLVLNYLWGLIWTIRYRDRLYTVCPLTTLMQCLRGYGMWDARNFRYWFSEELLERLHLAGANRHGVTVMLRLPVLVSGVLYGLEQAGIVIY